MALHLISGLMGAGKSYVAVNWVLLDELKKGNRDIYTNLPINIDKIAREVGGKSLAEQQRVAERIHMLKDELKAVEDAEGNPVMRTIREYDESGNIVREIETREPLCLNEARCFWRFTKPNSLIIIDESADLWEAGKKETKKLGVEEGEFGVYIRQHRHYKDDLWMICHNISDVDIQLRKKFHHVWLVSDSRKEPMFQSTWLRNIRYFWHFFFVRQYTASDLKKPMDTYRVFPDQRGYSLYNSFAAASRLPGKEMPPEDARSADYKPSPWKKLKDFIRAIRKIVIYGAIVGGGIYAVLFYVLLPAGGFAGEKVQNKTALNSSAALPSSAVLTAENMPLEVEAMPDAIPPEKTALKVVFRSEKYVRYSDGQRFIVGEFYEDKEIVKIDHVGVHFADGGIRRHDGKE